MMGKQPHARFELDLVSSDPTTITITLGAPVKDIEK